MKSTSSTKIRDALLINESHRIDSANYLINARKDSLGPCVQKTVFWGTVTLSETEEKIDWTLKNEFRN